MNDTIDDWIGSPIIMMIDFFCSFIMRIETDLFETILTCAYSSAEDPLARAYDEEQRSIFYRLSQRRGQEEFSFLCCFCLFLFCFVYQQFRHPFFFFFFFCPSFPANCAIFYDCPFFLYISFKSAFAQNIPSCLLPSTDSLSLSLKRYPFVSFFVVPASKKERKRETERDKVVYNTISFSFTIGCEGFHSVGRFVDFRQFFFPEEFFFANFSLLLLTLPFFPLSLSLFLCSFLRFLHKLHICCNSSRENLDIVAPLASAACIEAFLPFVVVVVVCSPLVLVQFEEVVIVRSGLMALMNICMSLHSQQQSMQGLRQAVSYVYSATSSLINTDKTLAIARIRSCTIGQYDGAAVLRHGSSHWQQKNKLRRFSTSDLSSGSSDETAGPRTSVKCSSAITREAQVVRVSNPAELLLEELEKKALAGSSSDSPTDAVDRLLRWDPLPKLGQWSDEKHHPVVTFLLSLSLSPCF